MFSIKSQKSYTHNRWKYPVRCRTCHEEYKKQPVKKEETVEKVEETVEKVEESVEKMD